MSKHSKHPKQTSSFTQVGQFLRFLAKDNAPAKRLQLSTPQGELTFKIAKALRPVMAQALQPGDWIQVFGEATRTDSAHSTRLKATDIRVVSRPVALSAPTKSAHIPPRAPRPQTILVCQKSDCLKRGGKAVCRALAETLEERQLGDRVVIKGTGCMHQCKAPMS
jgi:hypothetical protein